MDSLNHAVFLALNASADPARPLVWFAIVCAKYLFLLVPLHIAVVGLGGTRAMRFVAVSGVLALAGALALSGLIGFVAPTPRPAMLGLGQTLLDHRPSAAFPSNHAIVCVTWAATLAIFGRGGLALAAGALGLLVAWSRIYLGVHFPLDMVGAALIGPVFAALAAWLMTRHGDRVIDLADALVHRLPAPLRARP